MHELDKVVVEPSQITKYPVGDLLGASEEYQSDAVGNTNTRGHSTMPPRTTSGGERVSDTAQAIPSAPGADAETNRRLSFAVAKINHIGKYSTSPREK